MPTITELTPDGTLSGPWVPGIPFTVTGTNFAPDVTLSLGGMDVSITRTSATQLDGFVPFGFASGDHSLVVTNPGVGMVTHGSTVFVP